MNIQVRLMAQQALSQMAALRSGTGAMGTSFGGASTAARGFGVALASANLVKWGSQMQWIGRQIEYNFTLPLVAAASVAVKWALANEQAFTRLKKVYGDADLQKALGTAGINKELDALGKNAVALSNYFGVAQADVLNIAADWAAAGSSGIALAKQTQLTLKAMVLGELDAATATTALIAIQSQFAFSSDDLAKTLNQLNMVENQTGISMGGLIEGFSRAAGVARSAGIDTLHLAAMLAAMSPAAGSAAQAGNALKTIISRLLSPTKEAVQVLGLMGVQTTDLGWKSANASQRLELLSKKFTKLSDGQKAVVSATVASRYQINKFDVLMEAIANKQSFYYKALNSAADADKNAAQAQRELNAVLDSNPKKLDQIVNIMKNASAEIGQQLIPSFLMLANIIRLALQWFNNLDPSMRKFIIIGLVILALMGPLIRYVSVLATTLGLLGTAFAWVGGLAASAATGLWSFLAGGALISWIPALGAFLISTAQAFGTFLFATRAAMVAWVAGNATLVAGWALIQRVFMAGMLGVNTIISTAGGVIAMAWRSLMIRLTAITVVMSVQLQRAWAVAWGAMSAFVSVAGAAITAAWRFTLFMLQAQTSVMGKVSLIFSAWWRAMTIIVGAAGVAMTEIWRGVMIAMSAISSAGMAAIQAIMVAGTRGWGAIVIAWGGFMRGLQALFLAGVAGLGAIWRAGQVAMIAMSSLAGRAWFMITAVSFTNLAALFGRGWAAIATITRAGSSAVMAALTGPWGIAIIVVVGLLIIFWKQIKELFAAGIKYIQQGFNMLPAGVRNALLAVVNMVKQAAMAIYELFSYINPFAHHSPSLVDNVTAGTAVVSTQFANMATNISSSVARAYTSVKSFGTAIAGLLAKANAAELADVMDTFKKAGVDAGVVAGYQDLNNQLQGLNAELAAAKDAVDAQQSVVDGWKASLDAANAALDEQTDKLKTLQKVADATNDALSAAKDALQGFVDTPIEGETALNDAIKANNLEQKKLQLEMMKLKEATGPLDDIESKYNEINGMIEILRGQQASLRAAGAGSEITGVFDAQVAGLEAQRDALKQNAGPLQTMNDQLDALKNKADELDLEKAINFDSLHDQIEAASKSMKEMPFAQILAGVVAQKASVDALTATYKTQQDAVKAQQVVVDSYTAARDAVQKSYDAESAKLDVLQKNYNAIRDAISQVEDAMNAAKSAADALVQALEKAKKAKADSLSPGAQNFKDAAGANFPDIGGTGAIGREGGLGDQSGLIDAMTKDLEKQLNDSMANLNPFTWIKKGWDATYKWWNETAWPWIKSLVSGINLGGGDDKGGGNNMFKGIVDGAKSLWDTLKMIWGWLVGTWKTLGDLFGPSLDKMKDSFAGVGPAAQELWSSLKDLWSSLTVIWPVLKVIAIVVGVVLVAAFVILIAIIKIVVDTLAGFLGPLIQGITLIVSGIIKALAGLINFITGVFTGDWSKAWEGIKQMFSGLWDVIKGLFIGVIGSIWGALKGFATSIVDIFKWLYDILVGHSIIPDMVNAILKWMTDMPGKILAAISGFALSILNWAVNAWQGMVNGAIKKAQELLTWLKGFPNATVQNLATMGSLLLKAAQDHFNKFMDGIKEKIAAAQAFVKTVPGLISTALGNMATYLKTKGQQLIQGLIDGIMDKIAGVKTTMTNIANTIKSFLPGSPVKAGPMKGKGELKYAGQKLMTNLVTGIEAGRMQVNSSMNSVSADVSGAFAAIGSDTARSAGRFVTTSADALRTAAVTTANDMLANQAKLSTMAMTAEAGVINTGNQTVINLNGDLVLPNVSSGADAESFVRNLEALATGGRG